MKLATASTAANTERLAAREAMGKAARGEEWLNPEDIEIDPETLPAPQLWRMLIVPVQPKAVSKGGIVLPDQVTNNTDMLVFLGKVAACGPLVGKKEGWENAYDVKAGDWVVFGRYAGQRFERAGVKYILINDDEVLAKVNGPEGFRIYL